MLENAITDHFYIFLELVVLDGFLSAFSGSFWFVSFSSCNNFSCIAIFFKIYWILFSIVVILWSLPEPPLSSSILFLLLTMLFSNLFSSYFCLEGSIIEEFLVLVNYPFSCLDLFCNFCSYSIKCICSLLSWLFCILYLSFSSNYSSNSAYFCLIVCFNFSISFINFKSILLLLLLFI